MSTNITMQVSGLFGWREQASCIGMDTDLFYPTAEEHLDPYVRKVCEACPVRNECLLEGMKVSSGYGTWGGFTAKTRERMRRGR